jgi:hypothetical protein
MRTFYGLFALLLMACSSPDVCVPGTTMVCLCSTGEMGAQSCLGDGSGFGGCACGPAPDGAVAMGDGAVENGDGGVGPGSDAGPDAPDDAGPDADAGPLPVDAGSPVDAGPPPVDAGPSCRTGEVYDAPLNICISRLGTSACTGLRWETNADQLRLQALVGPLGQAGTDLRRNPTNLMWYWSDNSPAPGISWATPPPTFDYYAKMTATGMVTVHTVYPYQFCMRTP